MKTIPLLILAVGSEVSPANAGARQGHYNKRIVIILEPGDVLAMRLEKSRTTYRAELDDVFRQLAHWPALAEVRRNREDRAWRRR
jgi:hypothetical protein